MAVTAAVGMLRPDAAALASQTPQATLHAFYDALTRRDCTTAATLRPGYTLRRCRRIGKVRLAWLELVASDPTNGIALAHLKVSYTENGRAKRFAGHVKLRRDPAAGEWKIVNDSFRSHDAMTLQQFLHEFARPHGPPPSIPATRAPPSTIEPVRPRTILEACWSDDQFVARREDRTIYSLPIPDTTPPEKRLPSHWPARPSTSRGAVRWVRLPPDRPYVALTFDLCERANEHTGCDVEVVNILRRNNVRATFFAGGKWMRSHPDQTIQLMADPRFEIGNHAWTHGNLRVLRGQEMRDQIVWTQAEYERLRAELSTKPCVEALGEGAMHGVPLVPSLFRFPYGACNQEALNALAKYGLTAVQWSVVSGDPAKGQTPAMLARRVLGRVAPGAIVIMHANGRGRSTARALPDIIHTLTQRGYSFVTVSELLQEGEPVVEDECYESRPGDNTRYDKIFGRGTGE